MLARQDSDNLAWDRSGVLWDEACPNQAVFPEEKTLAEAATARYLARHTLLPVPEVFHYGVNPDISPFMIIQDLEPQKTLSKALEQPREGPDGTATLNPDISESRLKDLYFKMARSLVLGGALQHLFTASGFPACNDVAAVSRPLSGAPSPPACFVLDIVDIVDGRGGLRRLVRHGDGDGDS
ncbi:hypothetical protein LX36DRAFT_750439 [Colletotrichum falcatum]|nr:hypothetical protein LX36DRAFT_750439 [Colletotrichum falcatum]